MKLDIKAGYQQIQGDSTMIIQNTPYLNLNLDISIEELEHFRRYDKETYLRIGHVIQMAGSEAAKGVQVY